MFFGGSLVYCSLTCFCLLTPLCLLVFSLRSLLSFLASCLSYSLSLLFVPDWACIKCVQMCHRLDINDQVPIIICWIFKSFLISNIWFSNKGVHLTLLLLLWHAGEVVSKKMPGSNPLRPGITICSLRVVPVSVWVLSRYSSILPQSRHMHLEGEWTWWMRAQMDVGSICYSPMCWWLIQVSFHHLWFLHEHFRKVSHTLLWSLALFCLITANLWVLLFSLFNVANSRVPRIRNTIPSLSIIIDLV